MKKKIIVSMLISVFALFTSAISQNSDYLDEKVKTLQSQLDLTETQVEQIKEILKASQAQMKEAAAQNQGDPAAIKKAFLENREKTDAQIEAILTPEQQIKYNQYKEMRVDDLMTLMYQEKLNLTEEQAKQLEPIIAETSEKLAALKAENSSRIKKGRQYKQIMSDQNKKIMPLLNDAQQEAYAEFQNSF